jgi:oxygen-dependent protoporphyrinogen oxidase
LAFALRQRGLSVLVLESTSRPGGKIASDARNGYLCERGPASFLDRQQALTKLAHEVGVADRLVVASAAAERRLVASDGALHDTPLGAKMLINSRLLSTTAKLRMLVDLILPRGPSARGEEESVARFGSRRLGRMAGERLLQPLVSGLYAGDPTLVSLPSAFPLVATMERVDRSFLWAMYKEQRRDQSKQPQLSTFAAGMNELVAAIGQTLGSSLRLNTHLRKVERNANAFTVTVEHSGQLSQIEAQTLVIALPAHVGTTLLRPLDKMIGDVLGQIPYVPVTLVHLGYPTHALKQPVSAYGFFVPPSEPIHILGGIFPSMLFPNRAPRDHHLFSVRMGGARHSEIMSLPDEQVIATADRELRALVGLQSAPVFVHVVRHTHALPQYTLGHAQKVAALVAAEKHFPGLYFHGNAYRNAGVPELILRSTELADRIATDLAVS